MSEQQTPLIPGLTLVCKPLEQYLIVRESDGDRELTVDECRQLLRLARDIKKVCDLIDEVEAAVDKQTYDEHRKAGFDMPPDAELHIVITADLERTISRACGILHALAEGREP